MMKVLARPKNNAEQFCWTKKEILNANTSQNFALVCMRFLASTDSTSHLLSFASFGRDNFILTKYQNT